MEYLGNAEVNKNAKRNRAETIKTLADEKIASIGTLLGILTGKPETDPNTPEHRSFIGDNTEEDADPFTGLIGEKETVIGYGTQVSQTAQTATTLCNSEIAAAKANNKLLKENAKTESDADYESDWRKAVNAYLTASYGQDSTYNDALADIDDLFEQAQNTALGLYETAVVPSQENFTVQLERLNTLFGQAITAIDNGQTISENYLTDPDSDMEVCFVAGTPILMADGTSKPIEQIRPGDMVLAVDHNNPEHDAPQPSRVTRFFDNGLKPVVKLLFENQETGEQFEVVCTPSHRFYVIDKGWTTAENLQPGEQCQSANGEQIIFLSRESLDDPQHVYNFEVNEKHTYFVGKDQITSLLVHNACNFWGIVDSCLGGVQVAGEFIAGGADSLTFGITKLVREKAWGKELSKIHNPNVYLAGEITETVAELVLSCGTSSVKQGSKFIVKESLETIAKGNWDKLPLATIITKTTVEGSSVYLKTIDKTANVFYRFLGSHALKAQVKALDKLGDLAPKHLYKDGILLIEDVGETISIFNPLFWKNKIKGSLSLGTVFNDIVPLNMGKNGLIFDPVYPLGTRFIQGGYFTIKTGVNYLLYNDTQNADSDIQQDRNLN